VSTVENLPVEFSRREIAASVIEKALCPVPAVRER
jgi:hypothetical protein